ncbi:MAG: hypothetical protein Q8873_06895 [Bacillota bacterium]|nr:hypothetical protein [Bacillota bacterium]
MENKKLAKEEYEIRQQNITKKAARIYYSVLILNIILAIPPQLDRRYMFTFIGSVVFSVLVFLGYTWSMYLWVGAAAFQVVYYFFHVGVYVMPNYPMWLFLIMCVRSAFCFYSSWAFLLNYDVQDIVKEHHKKLFKIKK